MPIPQFSPASPPRPPRKAGRIVGGVLCLIFIPPALLFAFVFGFFGFVTAATTAELTARTTGAVTDLNTTHVYRKQCGLGTGCDETTSTPCSPTATYTVAGKTFNTETSLKRTTVTFNPCHFTVGDPIIVAYNPDNPREAIIIGSAEDEAKQLSTVVVWAMFGGAVLVASGLAVGAVLFLRRPKPAQQN